MQQGLRREVELQRCLGCPCGLCAELYAAEVEGVVGELCAGTQHLVCLHLLLQGVLLHLCHALHALCQCLRRESLAVDAVDYLAHEEEVLHGDDGVLWQELQERCFLVAQRCHLGHYAYVLLTVARELALHLEGAYGVYLVAEEVDAVGVFAAVTEHVDDASACRELSWLVNIIDLCETEVAHVVAQLRHVDGLSHLQRDASLVEDFL